MADRNDDFEKPKPHPAPDKSIVDWVVDHALGLGSGVVTLMSGLLAAVLILYSGYVLYDTFSIEQSAASSAWDLLRYKPEIIENNNVALTGSSLAEINQDYRAWLTVYDSSIDYPVMQGEDNYEYLNKDPYGEFKLSGSLFLDWRSSRDFSDSYSMIYGHHMEHGAMFGSLDYFTDPHYFENHSQGRLITEDAVYDLRLFAVAYGDGDDPTLFDPHERAAGDVLAYLDQHALIHMGCDPRSRILALSTCAGDTALSRLIVFCEMISH